MTGGTFYRSYDGVIYNDKGDPATLSDFRLDKYEITVGRFRKFKAAWDATWRPAAGAGKHTHLNGGNGLTNAAAPKTFEPGWDANWTASVAPTDTNLACDPTYPTWTPSVGGNETRPIVCANWYELAAFCIWDGGFLPSDAEWNYAAAGGSEQRVYPWSSPATSTTIDCSFASFTPLTDPWRVAYSDAGACVATGTNNVGSESPKGNGKYGQADLTGNADEWNLDSDTTYHAAACHDCAQQTSAYTRVLRGGGFNMDPGNMLSSDHGSKLPGEREYFVGSRCARTP